MLYYLYAQTATSILLEMKKKTAKLPRMAGEQDITFGIRMPSTLKARLMAAKKLGDGSDVAKMLRFVAEPLCDFAEHHGYRPRTLLEFAEWLARREKKKK
jgi:hypothetical protein